MSNADENKQQHIDVVIGFFFPNLSNPSASDRNEYQEYSW
jgi:hypothetical protein